MGDCEVKQKLIMENWRRFLKESRSPITEIDGKPIHMYFRSHGDASFNIFLYVVDETNEDPYTKFKIIGGIDCVPTSKPCIPKTLMVGTSYRDSDLSGKGIGPLVYDLAFFVAQSMGYGLTSDRDDGAKAGARGRWSKIEKDPSYEKKTTPAGNDTFDYNEETPDPQDDCDSPYDMDQDATQHAFIKKDADSIHPVLQQLEANHMDFIDSLRLDVGLDSSDIKRLLGEMVKKGYELFQEEYDLEEY